MGLPTTRGRDALAIAKTAQRASSIGPGERALEINTPSLVLIWTALQMCSAKVLSPRCRTLFSAIIALTKPVYFVSSF